MTWQPLSIAEIRERFDGVDTDWWIAGGLAIDLFLGWESRSHDDVDIEMFRKDRDVLFDVFPGWELFTVSQGSWTAWHRGDDVAEPVFGIWGRRSPEVPWAVEIMLANGDGSEWRFRREPSIRLDRELLTMTTPDGIRFCTPEVQLLYKAKVARAKDDVDFARCLHLLDDRQKAWLHDSLVLVEPDHPWVLALEYASRVSGGSQ